MVLPYKSLISPLPSLSSSHILCSRVFLWPHSLSHPPFLGLRRNRRPSLLSSPLRLRDRGHLLQRRVVLAPAPSPPPASTSQSHHSSPCSKFQVKNHAVRVASPDHAPSHTFPRRPIGTRRQPAHARRASKGRSCDSALSRGVGFMMSRGGGDKSRRCPAVDGVRRYVIRRCQT